MDYQELLYQLLHANNMPHGQERLDSLKQYGDQANNSYDNGFIAELIDNMPLFGDGDLYHTKPGDKYTAHGGLFGGGIAKDYTGKDPASLGFRLLQSMKEPGFGRDEQAAELEQKLKSALGGIPGIKITRGE